MNALLIPILLVCGLLVVAAFVGWMVFFNRSGDEALTDQNRREGKGPTSHLK